MSNRTRLLVRSLLASAVASALLVQPAIAQSGSESGNEEEKPDSGRSETVTVEQADGERKGWTGVELQRIEIVGSRNRRGYAGSTFAATKTEIDLLDLGQSVSTITQETIEEQGLQRLNEVAPFAAGVNEFSVYNDITIRGFRSFDDRRVNGMRTYNNFWTQAAIAHLERVEVIKGPGAATFGDASPGGVINLVTKKPLPVAFREVALGIGSFDERTASLDLTGPIDERGSLLYRFNVGYEDSGSFRNQVFNDTFTVAPSVSWLPRPGTRVNLDVVYTDAETVLDRGQPNVLGGDSLGIVPPEVSVTQPGDGIDTEDLSINVTLDQDLSARWAFTLSHMFHDYDEHLIEHRTSNRYISDTQLILAYNDRDAAAEVNATTAYLTGEFDLGATRHRLVMGVDHTTRDDVLDQVAAVGVGIFDVLDPEYFRRDVDSYDLQRPGWAPFETKFDITGYYVHDLVEWNDWVFLAGLRFDDFESVSLSNGQPSPEDSDSQLSPRFSVTRRLGGERSVYASWITGFEPVTGFTEINGGPFDPSDSELFEIGYKQRAFNDQLLVTASLYEITKNNIVVYANDLNNPDLYYQRGQERSRGFEFEAKGRIGDRLRVIANYAYNDAEVTEDPDPDLVGTRLVNAPEHMATLWTRYDLGNGFGIGGGIIYVSERETFEPDLQLPSYTLFNAGLYYSVGDVRVSLLGRNLSDREHWTGGYNFGRVFPGEPRNVRLSLRYQF